MTVGVFVGLATLDVIQHVEELPRPNAKVTSTWQGVAAGGPALNAAVTFATLGGSARLVTRVGSGPVADLVRADLAVCGVELFDVAADGFAPSVSSITVQVSTGERQVVSTDAGSATPPLTALPAAAAAAGQDATIALVDGHHPDLARLALTQCADLPRILDAGRWKPQMTWLVGSVTDVICSADFAFPADAAGGDAVDPLDAALAQGAELAAVSGGGGPLRWRTRVGRGEVSPPIIEAVDTLGAGDALHGAYAYARAAFAEADPRERLRFAVEVASRSCVERGTRTWLRGLGGATLAAPGSTAPRVSSRGANGASGERR